MENNESRTFRAFKMLKILREKNGRVKAKELLELLNLKNSRSIRQYVRVLTELGYNISSYGGYNGGYELNENCLDKKEIEYLKLVVKNEEVLKKIININNRI
jgi:predicted DNA-binding transcriptional regulator YafY